MISIVRHGDTRACRLGDVQRGRSVGDRRTGGGVAGRPRASAPEARDAAPLLTGNAAPADWDAPVPGTGRRGVRRRRRRRWRADSAAPTSCTASRSTRWRRRFWRRRPDCGGATPSRPVRWRSTPNATAPARGRASARPTSSMCQRIRCSSSCRRGWAGRERTRRAAGRALRDDHAAVDGGRHDDLPGVDDGRPRRAGGPHRAVGARRRNPGGGEAHRPAADAVLRSGGAGPGVHAVRRGGEFVGDGCRCSTTAWTSAGSTGSATA